MYVLLDTETQLLQPTGLVAVDTVLAGSPKPAVQQVEFMYCEEPTAYRNKPGSLEGLRFCVEQYVREVPADSAERAGAIFLERDHMWPLSVKGAHFERMRK